MDVSVCRAISQIPFVGGILSAVVVGLIDLIYTLIKDGINHAIDLLKAVITTHIVDALLNAIFGAIGGLGPKAEQEHPGLSQLAADKEYTFKPPALSVLKNAGKQAEICEV